MVLKVVSMDYDVFVIIANFAGVNVENKLSFSSCWKKIFLSF